MAALLPTFRLGAAENGALRCDATGVWIANAPLLRATADGLRPRPPHEVAALLLAAYGTIGDLNRVHQRLHVVAEAISDGEIAKAMITLLHLRLPSVSAAGVARLAKVSELLARYDPNEPRDWRGRWTTGGEGSGPEPAGQPPDARDAATPASNTWDGVVHPRGGQLVPTQSVGGGIGGNGPPPEDTFEPAPEPIINEPQVPVGWDENDDGLIVRRPKLPDGRLWPVPTPDIVRAALKPLPGGGMPRMRIYVPIDGKGPLLLGSGPTGDFVEPPGYETVELLGTPQETQSRGQSTNHAQDSVETALDWAATNQYSRFYFNRSFTTSTNREVVLNIRPDLLAVARPGLDLGYHFAPYESYSPGQDPRDREQQMPLNSRVRRLEGDFYKLLRLLIAALRKSLGRR